MNWKFWKRSKLKSFKQWQKEKDKEIEKGTPIPGVNCIRSNCDEPATHEVRSEYFGIGYCDEHWKDRDPDTEGKLMME